MAVAKSHRHVEPVAKVNRDWLKQLVTKTKARPASIVIFGPPGVGKTSVGAAFPSPVFLCDNQEDGISTLKNSGLISSDIPTLPPAESWADVISMIDSLLDGEHDFKYLVIDTLGGVERLCHEHVCMRDFNGDWGEKGFMSYAKGFEVALPEWRLMLNLLDRLRSEQSMGVVALAHSVIKPYKNPEGEDYDRFMPDMHHKTWGVTHKWADMILFANYYVEIDKGKTGRERAKGRGGQHRFLNTEYHAAYDAKNRHNLPTEIAMGESGQEAWANLADAIKSSRKEGK